MASTDRSDGLSTETHLPRRTLVAAGAWTIPVVAAATAAPAHAASPCAGGTERTFSWQTNSATDTTPLTNTSQSGSATGTSNTITVSSSYTGTAGSRAVRNMASYSVPAPNDSFELSNNIPPSTTPAASIQNNYQTATFRFGVRVSSLAFTIDDIDKDSDGTTNFWDRVAIIPQAGASASGAPGVDIGGSGTLAAPWFTTAPQTTETGAYEARQSVNVTISGGFTEFDIRYWTTIGATANTTASPNNAQMWVRIRNMKVKYCS